MEQERHDRKGRVVLPFHWESRLRLAPGYCFASIVSNESASTVARPCASSARRRALPVTVEMPVAERKQDRLALLDPAERRSLHRRFRGT